MKRKTKNSLISMLCCGMVATAALGVTVGQTAFAETVRVKPTGWYTETLTREIKDSELDTFKVFGASIRMKGDIGFRFLSTIESSDLEIIPSTAEFGTILLPFSKLGDRELTVDTEKALVAAAMVDTGSKDVPEGGLGYYVTLMGETLEKAFPEDLYGTVLAARAYVKYTYEVDGQTITDYAYSATTEFRSMAYIASCELTTLENNGTDVSGEDYNYLNGIIASATDDAILQLSASEINKDEIVTVDVIGAADSKNDFRYNLYSSNEDVAKINENGEIVGVGGGVATITAKIGTTEFSTDITVLGPVAPKDPIELTNVNVLYSTQDGQVFLPNDVLDNEDEVIVSAVGTQDGVDYFANKWNALALTDEEINSNTVRATWITLETSEGDFFNVKALSYAGVIDELSDFPKFFNNTAVPSDKDPAAYPAVAPNVYGYYIVTKNLGDGTDALTFTQVAASDFQKTNGFNGVLDGQGYTLKFKLMKGGLVGMILGNAVIKNLSVIYSDESFVSSSEGGYGVFGYMTNGNPEIRNCYIERTNNNYQRASVFGIMGRPNAKLILRNTLVYGFNCNHDATWWGNAWISSASTNAYLICGRSGAAGFGMAQNFTKVYTNGSGQPYDTNGGKISVPMADVEDASGFDDNYWTKGDTIAWKGADDMAVSAYNRVFAQRIDGKVYYSTVNSELILPETFLPDGETIVDVKDEDGNDYYENGAWVNIALTSAEINANVKKEGTLIIEAASGNLYKIPFGSYAGVIDELSDFPAFFNNDTSATHAKTYGYYVVTKDLGTGAEELALTQSTTTDYSATCGFNGVLDGQGYTLRFKLISGGLVGLFVGNATIKNLGVIYADETSTQYGVFGYMTSGNPVIENCYIERTNNKYQKWSVFGIMSRPNARLTLKNTVVYGYNISNECAMNSNMWISANSTNAYLIHARANATSWVNVQNFTKVFNDGVENGSREVLLSEIADDSGFDNNYWSKENGKLIWKGVGAVTVTWSKEGETVQETVSAGSVVAIPNAGTDMYWAANKDGSDALSGKVIYPTQNVIYYARSAIKNLNGTAYFSTKNNEVILPDGAGFNVSNITSIISMDNSIVYYEDGVWLEQFGLTAEQILANEVGETSVKIKVGPIVYYADVMLYAGVIDELNDFATFFNNDPNATAPYVYGYYIVTKDLGTGVEELALTQSVTTDYKAACGFNGVLDGQGHTLKFKLMSGALVGQILGYATIKNLGVIYADETSTQYGAFGYLTNGNPVIENCYIERTNNKYQKWSVFGIMSRPNAKLELHNTVVYGYNISNECAMNSNMWISANSTNAYLIHARANATSWVNVQNFTKVFNDGVENGSREVLLSEIKNDNGFNSEYWYKSNGKLIWNGVGAVTVTWEKGEETVQETVSAGSVVAIPNAGTDMYWAANKDGSGAISGKNIYPTQSVTYYACSLETRDLNGTAYFSTKNNEIVLPDGAGFTTSDIKSIVSADNSIVYYKDGEWTAELGLTAEQILANEVGETSVKIKLDQIIYNADVMLYAGVIDELNDFATFFNNDSSATAPNVYGYYIVTKDLGTGVEELALTQSTATDYKADNGFNGVLDGQGHTLRFKLMSGGLVGQILGNATIKNLGVIYEDATSTYYGAFGYMTNGSPVIENCYIERTNNHYQAWSVFGIMSRPNAKLILRNTVVYGYNISNNCAKNGNMWINETSTNAYIIHARKNAMEWVNVQGFTKVFTDAVENGSREVLLSEIADDSGFNSEYWYKANGKLIWKGLETVNISWVDGKNTTIEPVTKGSAVPVPEQVGTEYWSSNAEGTDTISGTVRRIDKDVSFYKFFLDVDVKEKAMYSTLDREFFLPDEVSSWNNVEYIIGVDENGERNGVTYYEDGVWRRSFGLTGEQINANEVVETAVEIYDGTYFYNVTVASYAGVIDELSDFPAFFNNDPSATHPSTYGYYIVIKDLGEYTLSGQTFTYDYDMTMVQSMTTDYKANNGFNGVLDGAGHTLKFNLISGGLVGNILGACVIKDLEIYFNDSTSTHYGVFGYMAMSGGPVIDNCYIQQTNNHYQKTTTFGIMGRSLGRLVLHNTVVYGFNNNHQNIANGEASAPISASSTNAYVICGRAVASTLPQAAGFTKVYTNGSGEPYDTNGNAKYVPLADITDVSGFNANWSKENEKLTWKGADDMAVSSIGAVETEPYKLVDNGVTEYAIILPDNADATLTLAGNELVSFFAEATGATLNVVSDGAYSDYDAIISIGNTKAFAASGVTMGAITSEGYHLERKNNAIYLNANTSRGCLYAVYGLLEELFDYEQYSADCYTILNLTTMELPTIAVTENPDIAIRMPSNGAIINDPALAARFEMKLGETDLFFNAGDYTNNKGETGNEGWRVWHNALEILPVTYWTAQGKTNWFSNNKVNGAINQLCYTAHGNADDYTAMVDQIVVIMAQTLTSSQITSRPDALYVTLTSEDGNGVCTCSACTAAKAQYGSDAGAVIKLCNDVREGMDEWMEANPRYKREVTLLFFAYNDYVTAPTAGTIEMREDVGVMYAVSDYVNYYYDVYHTENNDFRAQFEAWSALCEINNSTFALWTYTKNFSAYMLRADVYGENAFFNENAYRYFAENGVDLWFNQGATNGTTTLSAFEKLNGYIDAQMMWDSTQSVATLTDNWFNAMYGSAASYMRSLYNAQNQKARQAFDTTKEGIPSVGVSESNMKTTLTNSVLQTWFGYIDSAKNAINSDGSLTDTQKAAYLERINEEWISVEYLYVSLYYSKYLDGLDGVTVDTAAATAAFREVLGYDAATGTYAKDVVLLEKAGSTLTQWIESGFTSDI